MIVFSFFVCLMLMFIIFGDIFQVLILLSLSFPSFLLSSLFLLLALFLASSLSLHRRTISGVGYTFNVPAGYKRENNNDTLRLYKNYTELLNENPWMKLPLVSSWQKEFINAVRFWYFVDGFAFLCLGFACADEGSERAHVVCFFSPLP